MCVLWVTWLGGMLLFVTVIQPALKPAMPPVIEDHQPLNIFWATPTVYCQDFFNVSFNLYVFNIISNPLETQSRSTITIFHPNELRYYPYFSQDAKSFHGGITQNTSLSEHLKKTAEDIAEAVGGDQKDLVLTLGESATLGVAGVILCRGYEHPASKETCLSVQQSIQGSLGPCVVNVTSSVKLCSRSLCDQSWEMCWKDTSSLLLSTSA